MSACYQNGWHFCHFRPPSDSDPGDPCGAIVAAICKLPVTWLNVNETMSRLRQIPVRLLWRHNQRSGRRLGVFRNPVSVAARSSSGRVEATVVAPNMSELT